MCNAIQVRWTVTPRIAPQPWITCSGCGGFRAFRSSDKIRLNANGRKLDAWLIYKCTSCDRTWNRPIFERRSIRDIDSDTMEALQANDPHWIRREVFNLDALRQASPRVDEFAEFDIRKELLGETPGWQRLQIEFSLLLPIGLRLDRLLVTELQMSRSRLGALHKAGLLDANADRADFLRRRIRDGLRVVVDLPDRDSREQVRTALAVRRKAEL